MRLGWGGGLVALVLSAAPAAAAAPEVPVAPLLQELRARLTASAAFQSEFRQVNEWLVFAEADTAWGTLTIDAGGRFRLAYQRPAGHLVGSDGRHVYTFVPEERQVLRAALAATSGWGELFAEGLARPAAASAVVRRTAEGEGWVRIGLTPHADWALQELHLDLALDARLPSGYGYTDEEGNRIHFRFTAPRFLTTVPDSLFRFPLPAGYELFRTE